MVDSPEECLIELAPPPRVKRRYRRTAPRADSFIVRKNAFATRVDAENRLPELASYRREASARIRLDHPNWDTWRANRAAWELAMVSFPVSGGNPIPVATNVFPDSPPVATQGHASDPPTLVQGKLLKAVLSDERSAGSLEVAEWVFENLIIPWKQIRVDRVPSAGAIALLAEAKEDRKWFFQTCYSKLLNSKAQAASESWSEVDDGVVEEMANRVKEDLCMVCEE